MRSGLNALAGQRLRGIEGRLQELATGDEGYVWAIAQAIPAAQFESVIRIVVDDGCLRAQGPDIERALSAGGRLDRLLRLDDVRRKDDAEWRH